MSGPARSSGSASPAGLRWLCDDTVLRLGRELRALGFPASRAGAGESVSRHGTIRLTRSRRLLADRDLTSLPPTILLRRDDPAGQLAALERLCGIRRRARPWSLCVRCGGRLEHHPPESFRGRAPDFVIATTRWIARCNLCDALFWRGTHTQRQEAFWKRILDLDVERDP